jgi:hypothetical protein
MLRTPLRTRKQLDAEAPRRHLPHLRLAAVLVATVTAIGTAVAPAAIAGAGGHQPGVTAPAGQHGVKPKTPTPVPATSNGAAVSCLRHGECVIAGSAGPTAASVGALAARWNGRSVSATPAPSPRHAVSSALNAISCASAVRCMAVGSYFTLAGSTRILAESWNGSHWSIVHSPDPKGSPLSELNAISCKKPTACVAVGDYTSSKSVSLSLAEAWNGSRWSIVHSPNPKGATGSGLTGVSCASADKCMAVGTYASRSGVSKTLAEAWNGLRWSVIASPNPKGSNGSFLVSVSCPGGSACKAVGTYSNSSSVNVTLAESWNGARWSVARSPNPKGAEFSRLASVSCASARRCLAVGYSYTSTEIALAESWNGARWSVLRDPSPSINAVLDAVSCGRAASCLIVGTFYNSSNNYATLAERWNGRAISVVSQDSDLPAISCVSATYCVAVGSFLNASDSQALAEVWNGSRWSVVKTPSPAGAHGSYLNAVTCLSRTSCEAVGYYFGSQKVRLTLTESWNGAAWSVVPSPNPSGAVVSVLDAISCTSATACMAVGSAAGRALAETWNGTTWSLVSAPSPGTTAYSELDSVACSSSTDCQAVGYNFDTTVGADITLAETWNGATWSIATSPAPGSGVGLGSVLSSISCVTASSCLAVGTKQTNYTGKQAAISEVWTGSAWTLRSAPSPKGSSYSELTSVSCLSTGKCMAVGTDKRKAGGYRTLTESWNTTAWTIVPSPSPVTGPGGMTYLQAVSCTSAARCLATGNYGNPATLYPVSELWRGSAWHVVRAKRR